MAKTMFKRRLIEDLNDLPDNKIREVIDFVNYLKLKEEDWFIDFVNRRGTAAQIEKKAGKKFIRMEELQKDYQ
jgi:hypothetical protein